MYGGTTKDAIDASLNESPSEKEGKSRAGQIQALQPS